MSAEIISGGLLVLLGFVVSMVRDSLQRKSQRKDKIDDANIEQRRQVYLEMHEYISEIVNLLLDCEKSNSGEPAVNYIEQEIEKRLSALYAKMDRIVCKGGLYCPYEINKAFDETEESIRKKSNKVAGGKLLEEEEKKYLKNIIVEFREKGRVDLGVS